MNCIDVVPNIWGPHGHGRGCHSHGICGDGARMKLIVHVTEIRKAKGLTQTDLAKLANVSRKTINTIENNVFVPSTILALTLAEVLDVSVHDLFELPDTDSH